jgi:hypothetical protein
LTCLNGFAAGVRRVSIVKIIGVRIIYFDHSPHPCRQSIKTTAVLCADFILKMGFNTPPLGAVKTGGAGDLFPRIRKDFKKKSSIPRRSAAGILYFQNEVFNVIPPYRVYLKRLYIQYPPVWIAYRRLAYKKAEFPIIRVKGYVIISGRVILNNGRDKADIAAAVVSNSLAISATH